MSAHFFGSRDHCRHFSRKQMFARTIALISGDRRYSLSLVDGFFGGGENFAEKGSWVVVCSMGQVLMLVFMSS